MKDIHDYRMEELLRIEITCDRSKKVVAENPDGTSVAFVPFAGVCDSELFRGETVGDCVDTQLIRPDGTKEISARYIMRGTDSSGNNCWIYIENNGIVTTENGERYSRTWPVIITDSPVLSPLMNEKLYGFSDSRPEGPVIRICRIK